MDTTRELVPFHGDDAIAAALGTLLVQRDSVAPESLAEIADRFDVEPARLRTAVHRLGVQNEIPGGSGESDGNVRARRSVPDFLEGRTITREYGGVRDPELAEVAARTTEMSLQSWLLVEATKSARGTVEEVLRERLGDEADALAVGTRAAIGTAAFPERVLWVGISYPVDESDSGAIPAVVNPPSFPFDRLAEIAPTTLDVDVEHEGETFRVRNVPVVPFREPHYH